MTVIGFLAALLSFASFIAGGLLAVLATIGLAAGASPLGGAVLLVVACLLVGLGVVTRRRALLDLRSATDSNQPLTGVAPPRSDERRQADVNDADLAPEVPAGPPEPKDLMYHDAPSYCEFCGHPLTHGQRRRRAQYCSIECLEDIAIDRQRERIAKSRRKAQWAVDERSVSQDRGSDVHRFLPQIVERDGLYCCMRWGKGCGKPLRSDLMGVETDHIVPVSRFYALRRSDVALPEIIGAPDLYGAKSLAELDGANDIRNLAALCRSCNGRASNLTPVELRAPRAERSVGLGVLPRDELDALRIERWRVTGLEEGAYMDEGNDPQTARNPS